MEPIQFKCPSCEQFISLKSKNNIVPIDYIITCKYCSSKFKFIPQIISGPNLTDKQIVDILEIEQD